MRLFSTTQSIKNNEPSILAIIETLVAVLIIVLVAIKYPTSWNYIILAFSLSPFLLLTTTKSVHFSLFGFLSTMHFLDSYIQPIRFKYIELIGIHQDKPNWRSKLLTKLILTLVLLSVFLQMIIIPFIAQVIKLVSTTFAFILHPINSVKQIPQNWFRYTFCADLTHVPEIILGLNEFYKGTQTGGHFANYSFVNLKEKVRQKKIWARKFSGLSKIFFDLLILFYLLILLFFGYAPALVYRWSLKSTSLFYSPFIWIINVKSTKENELKILLDDLTESLIQKIKLIWSLVIIFLFSIIPFALSTYINNILPQKLQTASPGLITIIQFYMPIAKDGLYAIDSWHISRFLCALITILIFFVSEKMKFRIKHNDHSWDKGGSLVIIFASKIRFIFFSWTFLCGVYIAYSFVDWSHLPHINWIPNGLKELINQLI